MRAMVLEAPKTALVARDLPVPEPGPGQVLLRVGACGVCRTDLHVVDGELIRPKLPLVPGHEIVGRVAAVGRGVERFHDGDRVGVPWLGWSCGECKFCRAGRENLCEAARFTGYTIDGGYEEYALADARFCFPVAGEASDAEASPLLCAGLIGYRSLVMAGDAKTLGIYGFGAAAGARGLRVHAPGRYRRAGIRARPWRELGGRFRRSPAAGDGRRDHLRTGR
jgi:propanol-preferring alcohol dehydrogenase